MILLWGLEEDAPLASVYRQLLGAGAPVVFLDHREVLNHHAELRFFPAVCGCIATANGVIRLEEVKAAYVRPYNFRHFPELSDLGPASAEWQHAALFEDILWSWTEVADALIINRPSAMASNNSKPYQSRLIRHSGFSVPETLITTSADTVRQFLGEHGELIYKSISGVRSIVCRLSQKRAETLDTVAWCPTQFQKYIAGVEYRAHVVGERVFACQILSEADDYRYASTSMEPCELPEDVAGRCRRLSGRLGLHLSGIDLRRTPGGEWFCFEVNPSPAHSCFESPDNPTISAAIAGLLAGAVSAAPGCGLADQRESAVSSERRSASAPAPRAPSGPSPPRTPPASATRSR